MYINKANNEAVSNVQVEEITIIRDFLHVTLLGLIFDASY